MAGGSLHRYLSIQQTISAGTSLLPTSLGLSLVLVLAILVHGVSAHAWLENDVCECAYGGGCGDGWVQSCQPYQYLQLATLVLMYLHNYRSGPITGPFTRAPSQHSCFKKSPGFNPLAISCKSQFIYVLFISSPEPSHDG